ncbi:PREDICTED: protein PHLOEM PROTEIN 2-LIKE A8-like [Tarenaya hassleriana]|uniref:protein PHLOEM PROTEIN 2-LIKE A8-like n=1 Tax=Tarenaya hassleriana TaxID=28532 RepID=UPI00053C3F2D|nr:PREDICTED: protein PHLOEM PROTEIN 2-LIKE A8-like [Tarenaya hassleriana]
MCPNRRIRKKLPQVFISFRGKELRLRFSSHLFDAFRRRGIDFFIDEHELRGKDLKHLFTRIKESRIAIVIFSRRFARSRWCLNELAKINERVEMGKLEAIPIFYNVETCDLKQLTGRFGDNFRKRAKKDGRKRTKRWMKALESISGKFGLELGKNSSESDFIKKIVMEVERALNAIP